jgi:transketolase N-terminal domain/subunit/transketolase C-terminal domain/subunit
MSNYIESSFAAQQKRNRALIQGSHYMRREVVSEVLPFSIDIAATENLSPDQVTTLEALEIEAARTAVESLVSLAKINESDHLGGGLDLIPALTLTLSLVDYEKREFTIEHAHTSIGYYGCLAARGYLDRRVVIDEFRRGLDIAGHVAWLPGGTQPSGGRLGVIVPVAVGQALGKRAVYGEGAWVVCHCGDSGYISGQALNGFNGADLHRAPITFVMHRNGIQLSGTTKSILDKDPRTIIEAMGVTILETPTLHDAAGLYQAYREAYQLAQQGRPTLIYPVGFVSDADRVVDLNWLGTTYGILDQVQAFADTKGVAMGTGIEIPGALMSYRDVIPMLESVFLVNELPGGACHHDGNMKGRDVSAVLGNPMLTPSDAHRAALDRLARQPKNRVVTRARPAPGTPNLDIPPAILDRIRLPDVGQLVSPRAGVEPAYAAVAETHPDHVFVASCDLNTSTKLAKACGFLRADHVYEMSIEEQASALMIDGLSMCTARPQLNVFSTFGAFFEGIAREGIEFWRYQRNLNGANEGLNVVMHLSHVGGCTGRDHFSGWSLNWINLALSCLPYLRRFYAPADSGAAFIAVRDLAAHYGGAMIGIPRDSLPVLGKQGGGGPLYAKEDAYQPVTAFRTHRGAARAILAMGAPAFLAEQAAAHLHDDGVPVDVHIVNGLPLPDDALPSLIRRYPDGLVTIEDGIIGNAQTGLQGFAGLVATAARYHDVPVNHLGIVDPRTAPSHGHFEVWDHFGITAEGVVDAVKALG